MPGDFVHVQAQYERKFAKAVIAADAFTDTELLTIKSSKHQLFVQRITLTFLTHADKSISFIDNGSADQTIAAYTDEASPNTTGTTHPHQLVWDWGPWGLELTVGQNLVMSGNSGGSGFTAIVTVEGYQKHRRASSGVITLEDTQ